MIKSILMGIFVLSLLGVGATGTWMMSEEMGWEFGHHGMMGARHMAGDDHCYEECEEHSEDCDPEHWEEMPEECQEEWEEHHGPDGDCLHDDDHGCRRWG
jgi:hypothetical protein